MVVVGNHNLIAPMATDGRINTFTTRFVGIIRMLDAIKWYSKIHYLSYSEGDFEAHANNFARGSRTAKFWPLRSRLRSGGIDIYKAVD